MTKIEVVVATEGEIWPDSRTVMETGALYWKEPLPVTRGFNNHIVGKAADLRREGNKISATLEITDESFVDRLRDKKQNDDFSVAYSVKKMKRNIILANHFTSARLFEISIVPHPPIESWAILEVSDETVTI